MMQNTTAAEEKTYLDQDLITTYESFDKRIDDLYRKMQAINDMRQEEREENACLSIKLEKLLELLPAGVIVIDDMGVIVQCNPASEQIFQTPLLSLYWRDIVSQYFEPKSDDGYEISLVSGRKVSVSTTPLGLKQGQIILLTDQTETRALQDKRNYYERLALLGSMISKLAHQVKTPLSSALLYSSHLCNEDLLSSQVSVYAQRIKSRLKDLDKLVEDMLCYVRGGKRVDETIELKYLLSELYASVEEKLKQTNSHVDMVNQAGDCHLEGTYSAILGAMVNIIINAVEACKSDADIKVTVRNVGNQLQFEFEDNGPGVSDEIMDLITEPFFTTKESGTGLGLAIVKSTIQSHGGSVSILNHSNGAKVIIILPMKG